MCIYVDDDSTLLDEGERKARKPHKCSECNRVIDPGERYRYWKQLSDFGIETYKMCAHCWATIDLGAIFTGCPRNWWWGMAIPTSTNNGAFDETFVGDIIGNHTLTVAQTRTMVRCIRGRRRQWRKNGDLLPVPAVPHFGGAKDAVESSAAGHAALPPTGGGGRVSGSTPPPPTSDTGGSGSA